MKELDGSDDRFAGGLKEELSPFLWAMKVLAQGCGEHLNHCLAALLPSFLCGGKLIWSRCVRPHPLLLGVT